MGSDYKPYTIDMSPETPGPHDPDLSPASPCTPGELYRCLAWLGLRSAGGTLGQVEMLRRELVLRRPWLDDAAFSDLLAFSQSIPGPSSLQMVAALGALWGGGLRGAIGSSLVFSAPSVVVLYILAKRVAHYAERDPRAIVSQFFTEFGPIVSVEAPIAFMAEVAVGMAPACVGLVLYSAWRSLHALGADRTRRGVAVAAALAMLLVSPLGAPVAIPALVVGGALLATLASSLERTPLLTLKIPTLLRFSARKSRVQRDRERERERERDWDKHSLAENGWVGGGGGGGRGGGGGGGGVGGGGGEGKWDAHKETGGTEEEKEREGSDWLRRVEGGDRFDGNERGERGERADRAERADRCLSVGKSPSLTRPDSWRKRSLSMGHGRSSSKGGGSELPGSATMPGGGLDGVSWEAASCRSVGGMRGASGAAPAGGTGGSPEFRTAGISKGTCRLALLAWLLVGLVIGSVRFSSITPKPWLVLGETFYRIGTTAFGGDYIIIAGIWSEMHVLRTAPPNMLLATLALANMLPGHTYFVVIFVGTLFIGKDGAMACTLGCLLPAVFLCIAGISLWDSTRQNKLLMAALGGASAAAVGIELSMAALLSLKAIFTVGPLCIALATIAMIAHLRWPIPAALCVGSFLGWLLFVGNIGGPYCWVPSYTSKFPHFNETCLSWHNYQVDLHPISF